MAKFEFCRICLEHNVRMHQISESAVRDVYERITNKKILEDGSGHYACYMCYRQLQKCKQLVTKAQRAEELLRQVLTDGYELNTQSLTLINRQAHGLMSTMTVSHVEFLRIWDKNEIETQVKFEDVIVKKEPEEDTPEAPQFNAGSPSILNDDITNCSIEDILDLPSETVVVKQEITENCALLRSLLLNKEGSKTSCGINNSNQDESKTSCDNDADDNNASQSSCSDSEDDLPLQKLSAKLNVKKKKIRIKKDKVDAREVILTKKQQIQNVLDRSKSAQYTRAPWKCDHCYRGFYMPKAHEHHMRKHDPSSGAHACEICKLRYRTAYLLRGHVATSHARLYKCNRCEHASHTVNQASEHERWHNGYTYDCQECGQKFRNSSTLLSHKRKCHPTEHVCELCGENFIGSHGLKLHKSVAHSGDQQCTQTERRAEWWCDSCGVQFRSLLAWQRHLLGAAHTAHADQHGSQCRICGQIVSAGSMPEHMKEHKKQLLKKYACGQCDATFAERANVKSHMLRMHLGFKKTKKKVCNECGMKFMTEENLSLHIKVTHRGLKPFPCASCHKRFPTSYQLTLHSRTHFLEKPFVCDVCGKGFIVKSLLESHVRVHTGEKPYKCQYCLKDFFDRRSMKNHMMKCLYA